MKGDEWRGEDGRGGRIGDKRRGEEGEEEHE